MGDLGFDIFVDSIPCGRWFKGICLTGGWDSWFAVRLIFNHNYSLLIKSGTQKVGHTPIGVWHLHMCGVSSYPTMDIIRMTMYENINIPAMF